LAYSTLKRDAKFPTETSTDFQRTTRRYIQEDKTHFIYPFLILQKGVRTKQFPKSILQTVIRTYTLFCSENVKLGFKKNEDSTKMGGVNMGIMKVTREMATQSVIQ
jgi:hypothetical protein